MLSHYRLYAANPGGCVAKKKLLVSRRTRNLRLRWTTRVERWGLQNWRHVTFSDEFRITLYKCDGRTVVKRVSVMSQRACNSCGDWPEMGSYSGPTVFARPVCHAATPGGCTATGTWFSYETLKTSTKSITLMNILCIFVNSCCEKKKTTKWFSCHLIMWRQQCHTYVRGTGYHMLSYFALYRKFECFVELCDHLDIYVILMIFETHC